MRTVWIVLCILLSGAACAQEEQKNEIGFTLGTEFIPDRTSAGQSVRVGNSVIRWPSSSPCPPYHSQVSGGKGGEFGLGRASSFERVVSGILRCCALGTSVLLFLQR